MFHFLSGFIHRLFIRYFSTTPPQNECISFYIGKTTDEITRVYKNAIIKNPANRERSVIEIRLVDATLICEIYKDVCIDARLFRDKEVACESVLFESNQLQN